MNLKHPSALIGALTVLALLAAPASAGAAEKTELDQWFRSYLNLSEANRSTDGSGVIVAVVDSGVDDHPDLSGSVLDGADLINDSGSGRQDSDGHGTLMAGLIAAHSKGAGGAKGVAPGAKIFPVKVPSSGDNINVVATGIELAVAGGASVVNVSIGGGLTAELTAAVDKARDSDVVVVASAGNRSDFSYIAAPALIDSVLAVGAVDRRGNVADFSVGGPELDIVAPGAEIEGPSLKGRYRSGNGTSEAAAIVSGAAALLRSKYPDMTADEVVERLESTAVDKGPAGRDDQYGYGVLDIVAALEAGDSPSKVVASANGGAVGQGDQAAARDDAGDSSFPVYAIIGGLVGLIVVFGAAALYFLRRSKGGSVGP